MEFISSPPCTQMKLKLEDPEAGRIELEMADGVRTKGGVMAAVGGVFATFAAPFLRLPVPLPFKLVPLAVFGVGTGIGAIGAFTAMAQYSVLVERGKGVTLRWKWGPREPKELTIATDEIEAYEIIRDEHGSSGAISSDFDRGASVSVFRLVIVTRKGDGYPIEEFLTETQAKLRKRMIKRALRGDAKVWTSSS